MFHIDYNLLKSQVALTCVMSGGQATETLDYNNAIYYSKLALDCIVHVLNDKVNKPDDSFYLYCEEYHKNDCQFTFLGEIVIGMVVDIKRQFYTAGFDPRLKYKLLERKFNNIPCYRICMDLEETFLLFTPKEDKEDVSQAVSDDPSQEMLNELFGIYSH